MPTSVRSNRTMCLPPSTPPMTISRSDIPHCLRYTTAASPRAALPPAWSRVETCPPPASRTGAAEPPLAACLSGFGAYRSMARISPMPSPANSAIVASVSPRAASARWPHPLRFCSRRVSCSPPLARVRGPPPGAQTPRINFGGLAHSDHERRGVIHAGPFPSGPGLINPPQRSRARRRASTFEVFPAMPAP